MTRGLCDSCAHQKLIQNTRGSTFSMCLRHRSEPERFAKYPPLPVLSCPGHEPRDGQEIVSGAVRTK